MSDPGLRKIPPMNALLGIADARGLLERHPRAEILRVLRLRLDRARELLRKGDTPPARARRALDPEAIVAAAAAELAEDSRPYYRRVVNATGIILHTNLGRAPLAPKAVEQAAREASGYCVLEFDTEGGERGKRDRGVEEQLRRLLGATAATVVNNNAAACLVTLAALAAGQEVVVSRGELVEIGGGFRVPDVLAQSGAALREVGTTNRTRASDYEAAIGGNTALLLKVHRSNFALVGFTEEVEVAELAKLARTRGLPLVFDAGSGALLDLAPWGVRGEPVLGAALAAGTDLVLASGDKLLGGPQAGIIAGREDLVAKVRRHPLFRAVRPDKLALSTLEATLRLYADPETAVREVPVLAMIAVPAAELARRAEKLAAAIRSAGLEAETVEGESLLGGGSAPRCPLPTTLVALRCGDLGEDELAARLRRRPVPILARIQDGRLLLDPRTLLPGDEEVLAEAVRELAAGMKGAAKPKRKGGKVRKKGA